MKLENKSSQFTKIQELVYELKVGGVMSRNLITVNPTAKMSELRTILRDNRISGTPVVEYPAPGTYKTGNTDGRRRKGPSLFARTE